LRTYLYIFGYNTPEQQSLNEEHGWDDEESAAVLINAASEAQAREWGRQVAEEFLHQLFRDDSVSWKAWCFADLIESDPEKVYSPEQLARISAVSYGEYPDWGKFPRG